VADFSYQLAFNVAKQLPPISDPLVEVDFCSSSGATQSPPTLRFSVAANGTANIDGVYSLCRTVGTSAVTILGTAQFGTNADSSWVLLEEKSEHTAASLRLVFGDLVALESSAGLLLKNKDVAFFRARPNVQYQIRSDTTASTGSIQIVTLGE
jgi:hypothetical protein